MKKNIKLPAPQLSTLKEVNIELDMRGTHYADLADSDGMIPEDIVTSILQDLLDEDANKLTLNELRYLFMLVKIHNLENKYSATIRCTHENCDEINELNLSLSDNDIHNTPENYEVPKIEFIVDNIKKEYKILPPTMDMESSLMNYFLSTKNVTIDEITQDKKLSFQFTYLRNLLHLVDNEERLMTSDIQFEPMLETIKQNTYMTINKLYEKCNEVNSFGVQNKIYEIKCRRCGGNLVFRLPLLYGLSN